MVASTEEEIPGDEVLVGVEIQADRLCTEPHVPSAVMIVKCHFSQAGTDRYTVVTVLKAGETEMVIYEDQIAETSPLEKHPVLIMVK